MRRFPVAPLAVEWHPPAAVNRTGPSTAQQSRAQQADTAGEQRSTSKTKNKQEFSAALCTHLGVNIGVKGPTAFELFLVYRTLGERGGEKIGGRLGSGER